MAVAVVAAAQLTQTVAPAVRAAAATALNQAQVYQAQPIWAAVAVAVDRDQATVGRVDQAQSM